MSVPESTEERLSLTELYLIAREPILCCLLQLTVALLAFTIRFIVLQGPWNFGPVELKMGHIFCQMQLFLIIGAASGVGGVFLGYWSTTYSVLWNLATMLLQISYCYSAMQGGPQEAVLLSLISFAESILIYFLCTVFTVEPGDSLLRYQGERSHEEELRLAFTVVYRAGLVIGVLVTVIQVPLLGAL